MAADASHVLGAPELAGSFVNPKGLARKMTAATAGREIAGLAGTIAARTLTGPAYDGTPDLPGFGRVGYVAVTEHEVALVRTKTGAFRMKVGDQVLARAPRAEVASVELDRGVLLSRLRIAFTDGVVWEFDVPKQARKTAQAVVGALGGAVA